MRRSSREIWMRPSWVVVVAMLATPLFAHDFWIEPSDYQPSRGELVSLHLRVGDAFRGEPVARNVPRIERFIVRDSSGERPVPGAHGSDPAGSIHAVGSVALIGFRSRPIRHGDMAPARFESYLREEGLETVLKARAARGETSRPGREIYSRSAKAIIGNAPGDAEIWARPFGFRFEIVPVSNPLDGTDGAPLEVRVLFEGDAAEGVLVTAMAEENAARKVTARSDENGRAVLPIEPGIWLLKAVHMVEAPSGIGADWESIWATLSFRRTGSGR